MKYYILIKGERQGPFQLEELESMGIQEDTLLWTSGMADWDKAINIAEVRCLLSDTPPLPNTPPMPKTWLVESILVTCFCCLPLGIVGIINSTKVESYYSQGDYKNAHYYSLEAKKWTLWGFWSLVVFGILYVAALGVIALIPIIFL